MLSYFKRILLLLLVTVSVKAYFFTNEEKSHADTKISLNMAYRLATLNDIQSILDVYEYEISEEDKKKIIFFPKKFREDFVKNMIKKQQLFVAIDSSSGGSELAGFVKIYCVDGQPLVNILTKELHCLGPESRVVRTGVFDISKERFRDFSRKLDLQETRSVYFFNQNDTYIYYGCSYIKRLYRGKGLSSELDMYALKSIKSNIKASVREKKSTNLCFIYGQVKENIHHQSIIRMFSEFVTAASFQVKTPSLLSYWAYRACLPKFKEGAVGNLEVLLQPREKWEDYGCILLSPIYNQG